MQLAHYAVTFYYFSIIGYILSSWIPPLRDSKIGEFLGRIVEPYLSIFRRFIPPLGMIDISPIFAILVFNFIAKFALNGLYTVLNWLF